MGRVGVARVLEIEGTPRARGHRYGVEAREAVRRTVEATRLALLRQGFTGQGVRRRALGFRAALEAEAPDLLEEMEGLAEGARVEPADILAVNCRYKLMWPPAAAEASRVVAAIPPAAASVLLAQNADALPEFQVNQLVLVVRGEPAGTMLMAVEAGFVGGFGLNASGLGVCGTVLAAGPRRAGLPFRVLLRQILQCATLEAAEEAVAARPRAYSAY